MSPSKLSLGFSLWQSFTWPHADDTIGPHNTHARSIYSLGSQLPPCSYTGVCVGVCVKVQFTNATTHECILVRTHVQVRERRTRTVTFSTKRLLPAVRRVFGTLILRSNIAANREFVAHNTSFVAFVARVQPIFVSTDSSGLVSFLVRLTQIHPNTEPSDTHNWREIHRRFVSVSEWFRRSQCVYFAFIVAYFDSVDCHYSLVQIAWRS